jgi:N-acetylmuramoyl-L-alanine amidase
MNAIVEPEEITFGVAGINSESHHICYAGGMNRSGDTPKDTRTNAQKKALESIIRFYLENINPAIYIAGHYAFSNKACPSFNVPEWLRSIGIPEENIWNRDPFNMHFWHKRWNK